MQWYYSKNGTQLGPIGQGELAAKLASGDVLATDLVWREGMADWVPAGQVAELAATTPVTGAPAAASVSPYAPPAAGVADTTLIQTYLWQSIVVTIFCCWPLGIPAIVYAAKVEGLRARGDVAGAMAASANAKRWCLIALIAGLSALVLYAIVVAISVATGQPN